MKKRKKKLSKKDRIIIGIFMIMLSQAAIIQASKLFYGGLHNTDLAWNALAKFGYNLSTFDIGVDYQKRTVLDMWLIGNRQQIDSIIFFMGSSMLFIAGVMMILW